MLESLRIEHLAVVDAVEIELGSGLNVLTGETGAGKSIVLSALGLLAGGRASTDAIRDGEDGASVEAVFSTRELPDLVAMLAERGLAPDETSLVVRRTIARSGRHRARVSGETVPVALLAELFGGRLEISSQHESQALLRPGSQSRLLDAYGGLEPARAEVERHHARLREIDAERGRLRAAAEERARREDFLSFQVQEIEDARLVPGESARLAGERSRLAHAEQIGAEARSAVAALSGDPAEGDAVGATDLVARASRCMATLVPLDPELGALAERLRSAATELAEAASELERYSDRTEADPARLAELEDRLDRLERLRRKYGEDETAILAFAAEASAELAALRGAEQGLAKLDAESAAARASLAEAAALLSAGRVKAAARLAREAQAALRDLALEQARFEVVLEVAPQPEGLPCGPAGSELPVFRFAADPGSEPRELRRVASGGELSRVFLALKNVLRRAGAGMVLVFDEVDAGIGGAVADRVGAALAQLAQHHQVLCITHLPQVAARAHHHFRVRKQTSRGRTLARVERLADDAARIEELARMAGGARVGEATRAHARQLLDAGRPR